VDAGPSVTIERAHLGLLRRSILRAINGFQYEYPGTTYRTIIETLRRHADE